MINLLKSQLENATRRTQYALAALAAISSFYGIDGLRTKTIAASQANMAAERSLARFTGDNIGDIWIERVGAARDSRQKWQTHFWTGDTPGVIAARVQSALSGIAVSSNLTSVRIQVDPNPFEAEATKGVRFTIRAQAGSPEDALDFLTSTAAYEQFLILDDVNFRVMQNTRVMLNISGIAPYHAVVTEGGA